ncbi:hypothetical protein [Sporomusa rhizae]|uniref:hypothetical protein n=1 Tax=Sporomusa rhizae TaxID=357999 RepID=UPI00352BAC61
MENLTEDELLQRCLDILHNVLTISDQGKYSLRLPDEKSKFWYPILTEMQVELALRGMQFPPREIAEDLKKLLIFNNMASFVDVMEKMSLPKSRYFVKYGNAEHLSKMYESGEVLINPASIFTNGDLNYAQRDDELRRELNLHPNRVRIVQGEQKIPIKPVGNIRLCLESPTDYYIYCVAKKVDIRLFRDFEKNACLIIKNPELFVKNVIDAIKTQFNKKGGGFGIPVLYIDPLNPPATPLSVFGTKLFNYWYQLEYRVVFVPLESINRLEPIKVKIGSMKDYSSLIIV